jgi:hypothetical protein
MKHIIVMLLSVLFVFLIKSFLNIADPILLIIAIVPVIFSVLIDYLNPIDKVFVIQDLNGKIVSIKRVKPFFPLNSNFFIIEKQID